MLTWGMVYLIMNDKWTVGWVLAFAMVLDAMMIAQVCMVLAGRRS